MMETPQKFQYIFGDFRFETACNCLYFKDEIVPVERKSLDVLQVLIKRPRKVVPTEEIIDLVWLDNRIGITPTHLAQNIRKLRTAFSLCEPGIEFIKNIKGSGYVFTAEVEVKPIDTSSPVDLPGGFPPIKTLGRRSKYFAALAAVIFVTLLLGVDWTWLQSDDEDQIRKVVKDSQIYESLVLYKSPSTFREEDLDRFWSRNSMNIPISIACRIRDSVKKLVAEGRHYGDETKCEQFEFQSVEISNNNQAVVKTFEKWFISVYLSDGTLQRNRYVGPYFVSYVLRKVDGRWLIEKSSTARVNRPTPRVDKVDLLSSPIAGQQFLVKISGDDFEPETLQIEVIGPGCPETKPCRVPNSAV